MNILKELETKLNAAGSEFKKEGHCIVISDLTKDVYMDNYTLDWIKEKHKEGKLVSCSTFSADRKIKWYISDSKKNMPNRI